MLRGTTDPEVESQLIAIREVAMRLRADQSGRTSAPASASGSSVDVGAEVAGDSLCWVAALGVSQAADLIGITRRACRLACEQGRLPAKKTNGRWEIDRQDAVNFRAARAA